MHFLPIFLDMALHFTAMGYLTVSAVMSDFAVVFGASSVLEFAFTIPGLSYFLVRCMQHNDYNVIQSYILVVIVWMLFVHLVLNILLEILDVRRRK